MAPSPDENSGTSGGTNPTENGHHSNGIREPVDEVSRNFFEDLKAIGACPDDLMLDVCDMHTAELAVAVYAISAAFEEENHTARSIAKTILEAMTERLPPVGGLFPSVPWNVAVLHGNCYLVIRSTRNCTFRRAGKMICLWA